MLPWYLPDFTKWNALVVDDAVVQVKASGCRAAFNLGAGCSQGSAGQVDIRTGTPKISGLDTARSKEGGTDESKEASKVHG